MFMKPRLIKIVGPLQQGDMRSRDLDAGQQRRQRRMQRVHVVCANRGIISAAVMRQTPHTKNICHFKDINLQP